MKIFSKICARTFSKQEKGSDQTPFSNLKRYRLSASLGRSLSLSCLRSEQRRRRTIPRSGSRRSWTSSTTRPSVGPCYPGPFPHLTLENCVSKLVFSSPSFPKFELIFNRVFLASFGVGGSGNSRKGTESGQKGVFEKGTMVATVAAASMGSIGEAPPCRPWDRGDLFRRLSTFKAMTWFGKPKVCVL